MRSREVHARFTWLQRVVCVGKFRPHSLDSSAIQSTKVDVLCVSSAVETLLASGADVDAQDDVVSCGHSPFPLMKDAL